MLSSPGCMRILPIDEECLLTKTRKEDLGLYGNELNYFLTSWTIGYILGQLPGNVALTRIRPSVLLPVMEVEGIESSTDVRRA